MSAKTKCGVVLARRSLSYTGGAYLSIVRRYASLDSFLDASFRIQYACCGLKGTARTSKCSADLDDVGEG